MSEMVDRVSAALEACAKEFSDTRLLLEKAGGDPEKFIRDRLARAAIAEMREPTPAMKSVSCLVDRSFQLSYKTVTAVWQDMIDAALK